MVKLGGWWRVWIAISVLYGGVVAAYSWHTFPTLKALGHENTYVSLMSREAQDILRVEPRRRPFKPSRPDLSEKSVLYKIERDLYDDRDITRVVMPNGHEFEIASHVSEPQRNEIAREYTKVLQSALPPKQAEALMWAFVCWLAPVLLLCGLGVSTRWIYRGFKQ